MANCPRCTNDMERETSLRWVCPACRLVETIDTVSVAVVTPEEAREWRDLHTELAELMKTIADEYPASNFAKQTAVQVYRMAMEQAEKYDNLLAGDK